jgi:hypothetical protein
MANTPNTLTGLIPTIYEALDIVSRELVGFIPSVAKDSTADQVAKDQTIRIPVAPATSLTSITPGAYAADSGEQTIGYVDMSIDKSYMAPVKWQAEEQKGYMTSGQYEPTLRLMFAQAFRALCNQVEADIWAAAYKGASRAYGTAASTPFSSSLADAVQVKKILDDNGCPQGDRSLVINTTAGANLRTLANLMTASAAGTDRTLRDGILLPIVGFDVRESAQIAALTAGAMTGFQSDATLAIGETDITFDGGTHNTTGVKAGDIVTIGTGGGSGTGTDYATKYVVNTGLAGANSGTFSIGAPGLLVARADNDEITIGSAYTPNMAFHRNAIQLLTRVPAMPQGGDGADDVAIVVDPFSGIAFQIAMYRQYRQVKYEVGLAWGVKAIKSAHIATLVG